MDTIIYKRFITVRNVGFLTSYLVCLKKEKKKSRKRIFVYVILFYLLYFFGLGRTLIGV